MYYLYSLIDSFSGVKELKEKINQKFNIELEKVEASIKVLGSLE